MIDLSAFGRTAGLALDFRHCHRHRKSVFLNPLGVESPCWKREWLSPGTISQRSDP